MVKTILILLYCVNMLLIMLINFLNQMYEQEEKVHVYSLFYYLPWVIWLSFTLTYAKTDTDQKIKKKALVAVE